MDRVDDEDKVVEPREVEVLVAVGKVAPVVPPVVDPPIPPPLEVADVNIKVVLAGVFVVVAAGLVVVAIELTGEFSSARRTLQLGMMGIGT